MKFAFASAPTRRVDPSLVITDLFAEQNAPFDLVIAEIDGDHGKRINRVSDRVYFVLEGQGTVFLGGQDIDVSRFDAVFIPKGTAHGVAGKLKLAIITSPPFKRENEVRA
jgi:mannose-6-phosphate isomerase-like protein (cupin superfamily)